MSHRILRMRDMLDKTGFSRAQAYKLMNKNEFPIPIKLGAKAIGWIEAEVDNWIEERIAMRESSNRRNKA